MAVAKKIYVVKGSEDGNIGCYGNSSAAVEKAMFYVTDIEDEEYKIEKTRAQYITHLNKHGWVDVRCLNRFGDVKYGTAEVELFYLNQ